jgi:LPS-assembly protein
MVNSFGSFAAARPLKFRISDFKSGPATDVRFFWGTATGGDADPVCTSVLGGEAWCALPLRATLTRFHRMQLSIQRSLPRQTKRAAVFLIAGLALLHPQHTHSQARLPVRGGIVEIQSKEFRKEGKLITYEGDVDVRYHNLRLRADRIEFNAATGDAAARGNVLLDVETQHIEAADALYNIKSGRGTFRNVRGRIRVTHLPNRDVLLSENPFSFEAREVERLDARTYRIRGAWVTVCEPEKPVWRFRATEAIIKLERHVQLRNANFRFFDIPVLYLPYATAPIGRRVRQSGFLVPHAANTSNKGFVTGTALYLAPADWMDFTLGGEYFSRRGFSYSAELRAQPWENIKAGATFFAVNDRGLPGPGGVRQPQGGHQSNVYLDAFWPRGWRAVLDVNKLTSLTFRLAFAETFERAVNSEVRSTLFLTNNFRGFSLNFSGQNYKNFLSAQPETAVVLRNAPGVRFSSVEQSPWKNVPIYFGFHAFADAVHRSEPGFDTPDTVQRFELAPRVTVPLRWGPWLGVTSTFLSRTTRFGGQISASGAFVPQSFLRNSQEVTVDVRPPSLAKIFEGAGARWKHVIEPAFAYRYITGVENSARFLRVDENDTLTNTNEIEYGITNRFFRRAGDGPAEEVISWRVAQKHYFDPTFGGAIVPGQRNVFPALNSLTGFAFADGRRTFSPVVSDLRVTPGGRYDAQFRVDIDPQKGSVVALGTLIKVRPYKESFITLAHFASRNDPALQPKAQQIRALFGYGETTRKGFNALFGFSYDVRQAFLQNQVIQLSFNGNCCGIGFEYRRLALGPVRSENQFRIALLIANIGTFGNLRRQEKIYE